MGFAGDPLMQTGQAPADSLLGLSEAQAADSYLLYVAFWPALLFYGSKCCRFMRCCSCRFLLAGRVVGTTGRRPFTTGPAVGNHPPAARTPWKTSCFNF